MSELFLVLVLVAGLAAVDRLILWLYDQMDDWRGD